MRCTHSWTAQCDARTREQHKAMHARTREEHKAYDVERTNRTEAKA